ncbi:MAG: thioesterase family protein [Myxococcota bacterium]|jgi:acyl-CoA thioesterase|nr:thioesterase family protein [Myxococcota bacterium]
MEPADLARDTAVRPLGDGRYRAHLPSHWDFFAPSGGVLMTIALRAMQAEAPTFRPMAATTTFVSAVPAGELTIEVVRLREGNVATQLRATLRHVSSNDVGLEVTATFVKDREGPEVHRRALPADARTWDDAPPLFPPGSEAKLSFFRQVEGRIAIGAPVFTSATFPPGEPRYARWFRYLVPQRTRDPQRDPHHAPHHEPHHEPQHEPHHEPRHDPQRDAARDPYDDSRCDAAREPEDAIDLFDPLALPPLVDTMPAALVMALGSDHPPIFMPSLDLTVHFLAPTTHDRLLCVSTCRFADRGFASCDIELRDPDGALVAFGTQTMIVRRPPR